MYSFRTLSRIYDKHFRDFTSFCFSVFWLSVFWFSVCVFTEFTEFCSFCFSYFSGLFSLCYSECRLSIFWNSGLCVCYVSPFSSALFDCSSAGFRVMVIPSERTSLSSSLFSLSSLDSMLTVYLMPMRSRVLSLDASNPISALTKTDSPLRISFP